MTSPEMRQAMLDFLDRAEMFHDLADAERPHVLVAIVPEGVIGSILGPFPDLWTAIARASVWEEQLREGETDADGYTKVIAMRIYDPREGER